MNIHSFHEYIGNIIESYKIHDWIIKKDYSCGSNEQVSLFRNKKSRETWYCNVDILLLIGKHVRVIIEIEETDIKPSKFCGKILTSLLSTHYINERNEKYAIKNAIFIQILNSSGIGNKSLKPIQWDNIESDIKNLMYEIGGDIRGYKIFWGTKDNIDIERIIKYIQKEIK